MPPRISHLFFFVSCRASWAYLHTLAAFYPEVPDEVHAERMRQFMLSYGRFYPCGYCADTTSEEMVRNPPRVASRAELSQWVCELHNEVNDRLGKPQFDCSKVNERWRKAPPGSHC
jgi:FAD-linked sulfhydryl oxidase